MTRIETLMSQPAVCCSVHDDLGTVAALMWDHDCGALPVVDDDGKLAGMITDRDICMAALMQGAALRSIRVTSAMARQVISARREEHVEHAERLMGDKQVRRIPVVDEHNRPVGILSLSDLVRATDSPGKMKDGVSKVTRTLAAVCRPRAPKVGVEA